MQGGPYYDTNIDFQTALEERIFDADVKGAVLKQGDQPNGKTGRDVAAQCLIECLRQPDAANKVFSLFESFSGLCLQGFFAYVTTQCLCECLCQPDASKPIKNQ